MDQGRDLHHHCGIPTASDGPREGSQGLLPFSRVSPPHWHVLSCDREVFHSDRWLLAGQQKVRAVREHGEFVLANITARLAPHALHITHSSVCLYVQP